MRYLDKSLFAATALAAILASGSYAQPPGGGRGGERPGGTERSDGDRGGRGGGDRGGRGGGDRGGREGGGRGGSGGGADAMMRLMPVLIALDADKDGKISRAEIDNASAALRTLDKNKDGSLDADEMRPDFSGFERSGGRGGPDGGGRGGPDGGGGGFDASEMVNRMMQNDKNKDGKLTKDELPSERMQGLIDRADKDGDGAASKAELTEMASSQMGSGRGGGGQGGRGGQGGGRGGGGDRGGRGLSLIHISEPTRPY